jgi:CheY-like chemotaxis protein
MIATEMKRILIVEDNASAREGLTEVLRGAGYQVAATENGEIALAYLTTNPRPDLILLDMLLPVVDGWEVIHELQRRRLDVPVLVMTGSIVSREWALHHGCVGVLNKPFEAQELLRDIEQSLAP